MKIVYFVIPSKMRRNLKLVIFLSISWMFVMFYYFQSSNTKVSLFYDFDIDLVIPFYEQHVRVCVYGFCVWNLLFLFSIFCYNDS